MLLRKYKIICAFLIACSTFVNTGCMSYSTLQTADTLEPGEVRAGVGSVVVDGEAFFPEAGARIGVVNNLDVGLKYSLPSLIVLDAKYQFLKTGIDASFDVGWSYYSDDEISMNGFYPMVIIGQKHWYFGVKGNYFSSSGSFTIFDDEVSLKGSGYFGTSIITGGIIGNDNFKLLLELNSYISDSNKPFFVPGIGIYLDF